TELYQLSNRVVALNKINNSENVGQIVRICRAFGFDSLLVDERTTSPFLRRAVRVSMGNVFYLKVRRANNFFDELNWLKQNGYKIISCEVTSNSLSIFDFYFPDKFVLVFGNEDAGISSEVLKVSDSIIEIPIERDVDSLNVAVATAITLNEVNRKQRYKNVVD
ncbi:MAG: TrmH family RNA methyltransferase, partial [Candidatus Kapaibacteriota bacterium]